MHRQDIGNTTGRKSIRRSVAGKNGGAYRDRTDDLNAASVALSQLS